MTQDWDAHLSPVSGPPLRAGDPAPDFRARATNNPVFGFNTAAGRYLVLCFFGTASETRSRRILDLLVARHRGRFDDVFAAFFGVSVDPSDEADRRVVQSLPGVRHFWDFDGVITRLYGGGEGPIDPKAAAEAGFTLIVDPFLRVVANLPFDEPERHAEAFARVLDALPPPDRHAGADVPAPVLVLPRVFEPALCRTLIELYEARGGYASGFMREQDGQTVGILDDSFKKRRDLSLDVGDEFEPLRAAIRARVARRVIPAIRKAFNFPITRIERFIVACYDAEDGGFFRPHRDNLTTGTAHRRFAVTINLNADDYEGGDLRFPEFGQRTYRAPTGGAVVFGCGLLHEATPVTRGRRYATLPFLYDDAAAALRERNRKFLAEGLVDKNAERQAAQPA